MAGISVRRLRPVVSERLVELEGVRAVVVRVRRRSFQRHIGQVRE